MKYLILILFILITLSSTIYADVQSTVNTISHPTFIQDRSIKLGLITSFCAAQGLTGLIESSKFGGHYISNSADDYHIYRLAQDCAWISTGIFTYATIKEEGKPWWAKTARIIGTACYARDVNELTYRWNVTGSMFNYSDKYSSNHKAILLFQWDSAKGKFIDFNISGVGKQGAMIDIGFAIAGFIFNRIGDMK